MFFEKTNKELLKDFDKRVYGHELAKKALINMIARTRTYLVSKYEHGNDCEFVPSCIMLIGDSGTGKTFLIDQLAEMLDFPVLKLDATQLRPGGGDKEEMSKKGIERLMADTVRNWKEAQELKGYSMSWEGARAQLVVYIDEIDKLACSFESSGNWNKHIQHSLLTLIEGNTSFVFSGSFAAMEKQQEKKNNIGFFTSDEAKKGGETIEEAIVRHGMVQEFVGRLTSIIELTSLSERDYRHIMYDKLIPAKIKQMRNINVEFNISDAEVTDIVQKGMKSKQGVRYLKREIEKLALNLEFNYEEKDNAPLYTYK